MELMIRDDYAITGKVRELVVLVECRGGSKKEQEGLPPIK